MSNKIKFPTRKQVESLRLAVGMSGAFSFNDMAAELILVTQAEMERLGGEFSLRDAARLRGMIEKKYAKEDDDQLIESAERVKAERKKQLKAKTKKR